MRPQPGTGGDQRVKAQAHGLQQFPGDDHFFIWRARPGVSEMRMVSPMPSCSSTASAALEATRLEPMPAGQAQMQRKITTARQLAGKRRSNPAHGIGPCTTAKSCRRPGPAPYFVVGAVQRRDNQRPRITASGGKGWGDGCFRPSAATPGFGPVAPVHANAHRLIVLDGIPLES